jgi:RNA polymerase sigma-70 factor (ECF subfamily)
MRELLRTLGQAPAARASTEANLISAAQGGDTGAFDEIVRANSDALRRFVAKRVPSAQVEDIAQDTWVAAWGSLKSYTVRGKFKTWLYSIAINKCRDWHRRHLPETLEIEEGTEEPQFALLEIRSAVGCALDALSPTHRELMDLYYFDQLTLAEIAKLTGRNLNTVKYQFYRAHKEVAAQLEGFNG